MQKTITLYYDCLSPFSFLAFKVLQRYTAVGGAWSHLANVQLKPVLMAGIMASTKNTPPMMRPWAASQMKVAVQDFERNKAWFGVPEMKSPPQNFFGAGGPPDKTGLARDFRYMRCLAAISMKFPDALPAATAETFAMIHTNARTDADHVEVTEERLRQICIDAGLDTTAASDIVLSTADSGVKDQLKKNVAEAVALGAFGAPFIVVDDQVYFGSDRLEQMAFTHDLPWHGPAPRAAKL